MTNLANFKDLLPIKALQFSHLRRLHEDKLDLVGDPDSADARRVDLQVLFSIRPLLWVKDLPRICLNLNTGFIEVD
jgi:hypothetical protein